MGGQLSLHQIVREGTTDELRAACSRLRSLETKECTEEGSFVWTPVQLAAWIGNAEAVQVLYEIGADIHLPDAARTGSRPLHLAAMQGHVDVTQILIDAGAEVNATDSNGLTALHVASREGKDEVVKILCRRFASVNRADKQGATALHLACNRGHLVVVYLLIEAGASVLVVDYKGNTPMHHAAYGGHETIMERLLLYGAAADLVNSEGLRADEILECFLISNDELQDSLSTNHGSDTIPETPSRKVPLFGANSSINGVLLSGSTDEDINDGEVTSPMTSLCEASAFHSLPPMSDDALSVNYESDFETPFDQMETEVRLHPDITYPSNDD